MAEKSKAKRRWKFIAVLVAAIVVVGAIVWYVNEPHIVIADQPTLNVTANLQQVNLPGGGGPYYVDTAQHQGVHQLQIVNSGDPKIQPTLVANLGKSVHLFGIQSKTNKDQMAVLWINGKTLQTETNALPYLSPTGFGMLYQNAGAFIQHCLVTRLTQTTVTSLTTGKLTSITSDQQQKINSCFTASLPSPPAAVTK